jgi:hypothetical protein
LDYWKGTVVASPDFRDLIGKPGWHLMGTLCQWAKSLEE